jgi:hypothetical protein
MAADGACDDAGENGSGAAAVSRSGAGSLTGAGSRYDGGREEIGALLVAANGAGGIDDAGFVAGAAAVGELTPPKEEPTDAAAAGVADGPVEAAERGSAAAGGVVGTP